MVEEKTSELKNELEMVKTQVEELREARRRQETMVTYVMTFLSMLLLVTLLSAIHINVFSKELNKTDVITVIKLMLCLDDFLVNKRWKFTLMSRKEKKLHRKSLT